MDSRLSPILKNNTQSYRGLTRSYEATRLFMIGIRSRTNYQAKPTVLMLPNSYGIYPVSYNLLRSINLSHGDLTEYNSSFITMSPQLGIVTLKILRLP